MVKLMGKHISSKWSFGTSSCNYFYFCPDFLIVSILISIVSYIIMVLTWISMTYTDTIHFHIPIVHLHLFFSKRRGFVFILTELFIFSY